MPTPWRTEAAENTAKSGSGGERPTGASHAVYVWAARAPRKEDPEMGVLDLCKLDGEAALVTGAGFGCAYAAALSEADAVVARADEDEARWHRRTLPGRARFGGRCLAQ